MTLQREVVSRGTKDAEVESSFSKLAKLQLEEDNFDAFIDALKRCNPNERNAIVKERVDLSTYATEDAMQILHQCTGVCVEDVFATILERCIDDNDYANVWKLSQYNQPSALEKLEDQILVALIAHDKENNLGKRRGVVNESDEGVEAGESTSTAFEFANHMEGMRRM